jgi:hypothetical protein
MLESHGLYNQSIKFSTLGRMALLWRGLPPPLGTSPKVHHTESEILFTDIKTCDTEGLLGVHIEHSESIDRKDILLGRSPSIYPRRSILNNSAVSGLIIGG